jgi:putative oxidoreductase
MNRFASWAPIALSILRIVAALLFMEHGLMKLFHFPTAPAGVPNPLPPLIMAAAWIEAVGGALLALGLFTRPVAFIMSGEMAVGYWMVHAPQSLDPGVNKGEAAILYCFIFLYFAFAGAGLWSLDAQVRKRP